MLMHMDRAKHSRLRATDLNVALRTDVHMLMSRDRAKHSSLGATELNVTLLAIELHTSTTIATTRQGKEQSPSKPLDWKQVRFPESECEASTAGTLYSRRDNENME